MYIPPAHGACDFDFTAAYVPPTHGLADMDFGATVGGASRRRFLIGAS